MHDVTIHFNPESRMYFVNTVADEACIAAWRTIDQVGEWIRLRGGRMGRIARTAEGDRVRHAVVADHRPTAPYCFESR